MTIQTQTIKTFIFEYKLKLKLYYKLCMIHKKLKIKLENNY
jgi:hypothetical protein